MTTTTVPLTATLADLARAITSTRLAALESEVRAAPVGTRHRVAVRAGLEVAELADMADAWHCVADALDVPAAVARLVDAAHDDDQPDPGCPVCSGSGVDPAAPAGAGCMCIWSDFSREDRARMSRIAARADATLARPLSDLARDVEDCVDCAAGVPVADDDDEEG